MALRAERIESLAEELFLLQILGDDRAIAQTYVAGRPMKPERHLSRKSETD
jgi:guanine deaminase